ncbi:uncharacterized protein LOC111619978 [Centruroides sculpturatus]|uniref:uncharacterized protein LOC111619977 n=1 Tax=Centruroides sculpturatus TaxID=218467 RepID=UPI000C6C9340|nr:uncharacterized protein LOC111619977 [Centruroides sculpturatus]XP_023217584.1 uncharacterized protein LOC111619978 [Centruroides sculpturatus]
MGKWTKYSRSFRKEWLQDKNLKDWISEDPTAEDHVFCKYCKCSVRAHYSDLMKHVATKKHKSNEVQCGKFQPLNVLEVPRVLPLAKIRREARIALFAAMSTSINSVDTLGEILNDEFKDVSNGKETFHMHRTKCSALIKNVLGPYLQQKHLEDLKTATKFSLMIDESTDVSDSKLLALCSKHYSRESGKMITCFLDVVEIQDGCATTMHDAVVYKMQELGLDKNKLIGIATDGAASMCGRNNSLYTHLRDFCGYDLIHVKCICHSLDLVASAAKDELPSNISFMLQETTEHFSHSTLRKNIYKHLFHVMNDTTDEVSADPLKLTTPSKTRWLSISLCVERILNQYEDLKLYFSVYPAKDYKIRLLSEMYGDARNKAYLLFLDPILSELRRVNLLFQSENIDTFAAINELQSLFISFAKRIIKPSVINNHSLEQFLCMDLMNLKSVYLLIPDCDLGTNFHSFLETSSFSVHSKFEIKERCFNFLKTTIHQLQIRLPNSIQWSNLVESVRPAKLLQIYEIESIIKNISKIPKSICDFNSVELEKMIRCVQNIPGITPDTTGEHFWKTVIEYKDTAGNNPATRLAEAALNILTLPISNASVERAFSAVNYLKSDTRNRMGLQLLRALLHIRFYLLSRDIRVSECKLPEELLKSINSSMYD